MADNRSLDEFIGADESGASGSEQGATEPDDDPAAAPVDPDPGVEDAVDEPVTAEVTAPDTAADEPADGTGMAPPDAGASAADGDGADAETAGDEEPAAVEPTVETFAWSPDGGECAACGASVEERWRDGPALVCGDCKAW